MKRAILFFVGCLTVACSQRQDLADFTANPDAAAAVLHSHACVPAAPVDAGAPAPVVAVWDGYMEQSFMTTGDDQVHLVVRSTSAGELSATVVFGVAAPPPPPPATSDSCDPVDPTATAWNPSSPTVVLLEGFEYQATGVTMSDVRLKFGVPIFQPLAAWCACQRPYAGSITCLPNVPIEELGSSFDTTTCDYILQAGNGYPATRITSNCCRVSRCISQECVCDETNGCTYNSRNLTQYDLSINGAHADGNALHLIRTQ